jgi:putative hemolysin
MEVKMLSKMFLSLFVLVSLVFLAACDPEPASPIPAAGLANPASVFCEKNGGKLDMRLDTAGGMTGVCVFPDGSECEEWAYFRAECKPGGAAAKAVPTAAPARTEPALTQAADTDSDGWKTYRSETFGYSFRYPADAAIVENDDPLKSIAVVGPLVAGDNWPQITISHPSDREDYRPPEGTDLVKWLTSHNLLGDERQPDVRIAGTVAVHTRHARSPQSYAYDRYYFAQAGQLYMIVIGHTADKEDWKLYSRFLESFQFTR